MPNILPAAIAESARNSYNEIARFYYLTLWISHTYVICWKLGHFMQGSGLSETLGTIYGEKTVNKMFSGKLTTRALRGLFLTERILTIEIQGLLLSGNIIDQEDIDCIQNEINKLRNGDVAIKYIDPNKITKIITAFENRMMELSGHFQHSKAMDKLHELGPHNSNAYSCFKNWRLEPDISNNGEYDKFICSYRS